MDEADRGGASKTEPMYLVHAGIALGRHPAHGIHALPPHIESVELGDTRVTGQQRIAALVRAALHGCLNGGPFGGDVPLILASSNGAAQRFDADDWRHAYDSASWLHSTPWAGRGLPVVSGSCVSGMQALFLARRCLGSGAPEVVVAAVDIRSPANEDNFRGLQLLGSMLSPWQVPFSGFPLGEAAIVLRLASRPRAGSVPITGPILRSLGGPRACLHGLGGAPAMSHLHLVLAQATGPAQRDGEELQALAEQVPLQVPLTSAVPAFGHTLGASGLLSMALAHILTKAPVPQLGFPGGAAAGRPLFCGRPLSASASCLVISRALSDASAAVVSGADQPTAPSPRRWTRPQAVPRVFTPWLRALSDTALVHRPRRPPAGIVVTLEEPVALPHRACIQGKPLPSAVPELTPGFVAQRIAAIWGYDGPSFCLVGRDAHAHPLARQLGLRHIAVHGQGHERALEWNMRDHGG